MIADVGVIGPHVRGKSVAGYSCFEAQLLASITWVYRVFRDHLASADISVRVNDVYYEFLASFAAVILEKMCKGALDLTNRTVVVDFSRLFIDVVRLYRTPLCAGEQPQVGV